MTPSEMAVQTVAEPLETAVTSPNLSTLGSGGALEVATQSVVMGTVFTMAT